MSKKIFFLSVCEFRVNRRRDGCTFLESKKRHDKASTVLHYVLGNSVKYLNYVEMCVCGTEQVGEVKLTVSYEYKIVLAGSLVCCHYIVRTPCIKTLYNLRMINLI